MSRELRPEIQEHIREIARGISVANNLDEPIQRELYGHMEDKLLGYMNGEERISEADALILVREHFGKPDVVKELLQQVHQADIAVSFFRRSMAIAIVSLAIPLVVNGISNLIVKEVVLRIAPDSPWGYNIGYRPIQYAATILILVCILGRWQHAITMGRPVWFLRWKLPWVLLLLAVLACASAYCPMALMIQVREATSPLLRYLEISCRFVASSLMCAAWIWWLGSPLRGIRATGKAAIAWFLFCLGLSMVNLPRIIYYDGEIRMAIREASLYWLMTGMVHLGVTTLGKFAETGVIAGLVYFGYRIAQSRRARALVAGL